MVANSRQAGSKEQKISECVITSNQVYSSTCAAVLLPHSPTISELIKSILVAVDIATLVTTSKHVPTQAPTDTEGEQSGEVSFVPVLRTWCGKILSFLCSGSTQEAINVGFPMARN